ncbi:MAG: aminopeptidase [Clostridia bacterium]|nr:aminopeptidase [Clostridia bacterium]
MNKMYVRKNGWENIKAETKKQIMDFCEGYKEYLDNGKTERLCCENTIKIARHNGFKSIDEFATLSPGDKVYVENKGKGVMLAVVGKEPIANGINLVAAHMDAPRLDLKQNPLYEDTELALFKTHYYGGIKKYQWTAVPLEIHGVLINSKGEKIIISIGADEKDPVFCVTDLLPHLADNQMKKTGRELIDGENLNVLIGSICGDKEKDKVKTAVLDIIYDKYGIVEEDFISGEIEVVPAVKARDVGFDRSLIGAYGQDDRVCSYTALKGILETEKPQKTAVCLLVDKEEIGSMGNTGMRSSFFQDTLAIMISMTCEYNDLLIRKALANSVCLSADVGAAVDPNYKEVYEINNSPLLNYGVLITKYTGSRGKGGSNDASAELVGFVRNLFNNADVNWQIGELGKVDAGGGGTVAQYVANLNVETIDCGVPVLSMHSPFEITSKLDVYMTYKAYKAFYNCERN